MEAMSTIQVIREPAQAELLLHPLRAKVLAEARTPSSAAEIARRLGEPPQKVNYHVGALAGGGLLELVEERRRGNLLERRYRATARRYLLSHSVLGSLGIAPAGVSEPDAFSAARLLGLLALAQEEVAAAVRTAAEAPRAGSSPVPTLSLDAEIHFASGAQRARFASELEEAVRELAARYGGAADMGASSDSRPFRLILGCYPLCSTGERQ